MRLLTEMIVVSVIGSKLRKSCARPVPKYAPSAHKDLGKVDHAVGASGQADAGEAEVAFDVAAVAGAVQPAVDDFTGGHGSGGDVLRGYVEGAEAFFYDLDTL